MLSLVLPPVCALTKYHRRSRRIGTAERARDVVDLGERRRRRDTLCHQLGGEVVGLEMFRRCRWRRASRASSCRRLFGTMFITRPAVSDSPERARCRERDLLRLADIDDVAGRRIAARRTPDVQPIERGAALRSCGRREWEMTVVAVPVTVSLHVGERRPGSARAARCSCERSESRGRSRRSA